MHTLAVDLFYFLYLLSCTDLDRFVRERIIVVYACTPILVYSYHTQTHLHIYTHIIYSYKHCNGNILATVHIYIYIYTIVTATLCFVTLHVIII